MAKKGFYIVIVKRPNRPVRYIARVNNEFKLVDAELFAACFTDYEQARAVVDAARSLLEESTTFTITKFNRERAYYGKEPKKRKPKQYARSAGKSNRRGGSSKKNKHDAEAYLSQLAEERYRYIPENPNPFPTYGKTNLPYVEVEHKVDCKHCGICRDCLDRLYGTPGQ